MDETKKMLRSILVSSPLEISVKKLNSDFRELVGSNIPFRDLGYDNLLAFLQTIPDVLKVKGNSLDSLVSLVVNEKTAHVNDMVLRQKRPKHGPGGFSSTVRRTNRPRARYSAPPRMAPIQQYPFGRPPHQPVQYNCYPPSYNHYNNLSHNINFNQASHQNKMVNSQVNTRMNQNQEHLNNSVPKVADTTNSNIHIKKLDNSQIQNTSHLNRSRTEYRKNIINTVPEIDLKLKESGEILKSDDTKVLRRIDYKNELKTDYSSSRIPSLLEIETEMKHMSLSNDELLKKDTDDFMRQLLLVKETLSAPTHNFEYKDGSSQPNRFERIEGDEKPEYIATSSVPKNIQDNLKKLMSYSPEGIWCSELPNEYKKMFRRELDYEDLGFRCLINMCMDLDNIFHCSKESLSDFKLYDVRKPLPHDRKLRTPESISKFETSTLNSHEVTHELMPQLDWNSYRALMPEDAVPLGLEIPKDFIDETISVGDIIHIVVAEIYDPSKFWVYKYNGELDALMDRIQSFYQENLENYKIPEYLLEMGLYCVVVALNEYHRALIVSAQRGENYVKVFFIDYGSLGTAPKKEVYFLTKKFSELPAQAIRARLANIYPPVENCTWEPEATKRFTQLASMKHFEATICKITPNKFIIEVLLENLDQSLGKYINDTLENEGFALSTSKTREKSIEDPNCIPKVKFVHLFPTFEEIEYWLVPSIEQLAELWKTDLSPDFFFPQYFTKPIDTDLIDNIERKTRKMLKKREKLIKYIDVKQLASMPSMAHMTKLAFADSTSRHFKYISEESEEGKLRTEENLEEKFDENAKDIFINNLRIRKSIFEVADRSEKNSIQTNDVPSGTLRQFFGGNFVDEDKKKPMFGLGTRKNRTDDFIKRVDNAEYFSELEKYLSEEDDPSSREPSPKQSAHLIEVDSVHYSSPKKTNASNTVSSELSFEVSNSDFTRYGRRKLNSFFTDSSSSDLEPSSILDKPVKLKMNTSRQRRNSKSSDLIQFDVELDNAPLLIPEVVNYSILEKSNPEIETKPMIPFNLFDNLSDADDEDDSDSKLNPNAKDFILKSPKSRLLPQFFNSDQLNTTSSGSNLPDVLNLPSLITSKADVAPSSSNVPNAPGAAPVSSNVPSVTSDIPKDSNVVSSSSDVQNVSDMEVSLVKSNEDVVHEISSSSEPNLSGGNGSYGGNRRNGFVSNSPISLRPPPGFAAPPGFGPLPGYSFPGYGMSHPRFTTYQPWSTQDCSVGPPMGFPRMPNALSGPMGLTPQHIAAQFTSMYQCPPILVFNFNGVPGPQQPGPQHQGFSNPNMPPKDNYQRSCDK